MTTILSFRHPPVVSAPLRALLLITLVTWPSTLIQAFQPGIPVRVRTRPSLPRQNLVPSDAAFDWATTAATTDWMASTTTTSVLSQLDSFWQTCPYQAAALVCGLKASAADWVAQSQQQQQQSSDPEEGAGLPESVMVFAPEKPQDSYVPNMIHHSNDAHRNTIHTIWDPKRNVAFVLYGALYQGMAHEFIFNHLYPVWFGTGVEWSVVATKVAFNLLVQTTLVTLPFCYLCKAAICGGGDVDEEEPDMENHDSSQQPCPDGYSRRDHDHHINIPTTNAMEIAFSKYVEDIQTQGLLWKCFALWGPVQCLTFSIVPEHLRVTFIAFVSFFWLILLSHISSSTDVTTELDSDLDTV